MDSCDSDSLREADTKDKGVIPQFPSSPGMPQPLVPASGFNMPLFPSGSGVPQFPTDCAPAMPNFPLSHEIDQKFIAGGVSPPPYTSAQSPPPSGFRIPLTATDVFPDPQTLGQPPCYDSDGSPVYIGSALMGNSVHPCKIGKHLRPYVAVPYGGKEHGHHGRYDLLPYNPAQMEFVPTSHGKLPYGRRPIEGGYEDSGARLYHAVGLINGVRVPGKTGEHLGACNVSFGGAEQVIKHYEILCWK